MKKYILIGVLIGFGIFLIVVLLLSFSISQTVVINFFSLGEKLKVQLLFLTVILIAGFLISLRYFVFVIMRLFSVTGTKMLKYEVDSKPSFYNKDEEEFEKNLKKSVEEENEKTKKLILFYFSLLSLICFSFILSATLFIVT